MKKKKKKKAPRGGARKRNCRMSMSRAKVGFRSDIKKGESETQGGEGPIGSPKVNNFLRADRCWGE